VIGKAKAAHTSKANQGIHLLRPIIRQVFSHRQESRVPSCVMVIWEEKRHHAECPPSSFFFTQLFIAEHDVIWHGTCLYSAGVCCAGCAPSQLLVHPQPPGRWSGVRSRKDIDSV